MATTYTTPAFNRPAVFAKGYPGVVRVWYDVDLDGLTADTTYALTDGDMFKCMNLPPDAIIVGGGIVGRGILDDGATPALVMDLQVTDGTTTKTVADACGTFASANTHYSSYDVTHGVGDGLGYEITDDDFYVNVEVITTAAGDAATSAYFSVYIDYLLNKFI